MPLFARPELAFIIGSAPFCKKRVRASEIPHKAKPPICWRMITEEEYGFMAEEGAREVSFPRAWFHVLCTGRAGGRDSVSVSRNCTWIDPRNTPVMEGSRQPVRPVRIVIFDDVFTGPFRLQISRNRGRDNFATPRRYHQVYNPTSLGTQNGNPG